MLVVLASRGDTAARAWVERQSDWGATLLTPADLSVAGWRHRVGNLRDSRAVLGGEAIAPDAISGVLTRLPRVFEPELTHIVPADRTYVAAEMTAFLTSWLSELPCRMLNRPSPISLMGPSWPSPRWIHAAAQLGMAVRPAGTASPEFPPSDAATVTVIGDRCVGEVDPELSRKARHLARAAARDLLVACFAHPGADAAFVGAHFWADLRVPAIADAILEYFARD